MTGAAFLTRFYFQVPVSNFVIIHNVYAPKLFPVSNYLPLHYARNFYRLHLSLLSVFLLHMNIVLFLIYMITRLFQIYIHEYSPLSWTWLFRTVDTCVSLCA